MKADNYPGPMPASVMNLPNVPVHENSRSTTTLSSGRGNVLSHGLSSSHPRSARYQVCFVCVSSFLADLYTF